MYYLLGIITGLLISVLIVTTLIFFRKPIEQKTNQIKSRIEMAGPRPRGFIIDAPDEAEETREEIIDKNRKDGRDTPISDLM